jgi:hypothetical protein
MINSNPDSNQELELIDSNQNIEFTGDWSVYRTKNFILNHISSKKYTKSILFI